MTEPSNLERGIRGGTYAHEYARDNDYGPHDQQAALVDLITDLLHYADGTKHSTGADVLHMATAHYQAETA